MVERLEAGRVVEITPVFGLIHSFRASLTSSPAQPSTQPLLTQTVTQFDGRQVLAGRILPADLLEQSRDSTGASLSRIYSEAF